MQREGINEKREKGKRKKHTETFVSEKDQSEEMNTVQKYNVFGKSVLKTSVQKILYRNKNQIEIPFANPQNPFVFLSKV